MTRLKQATLEFFRDEHGATMVEYGLLLALIAVVALVAVSGLGRSAKQLFTVVGGTL